MDNYFTPTVGQTYDHTNGDSYTCLCLSDDDPHTARLQRFSDQWTLIASTRCWCGRL